jgi:hypothetical protein
MKPELTCVAELSRHLKSVNVVRFSGDGKYIASADDGKTPKTNHMSMSGTFAKFFDS